ncbi:hypothetical protein CCYA_CCYA17G4277 [Cyanidiococcus yangmingshanensis]|nr:hypothetical protein CCYA_CCYA17G4277 [Cyanidiococcus yangmingshanensis]
MQLYQRAKPPDVFDTHDAFHRPVPCALGRSTTIDIVVALCDQRVWALGTSGRDDRAPCLGVAPVQHDATVASNAAIESATTSPATPHRIGALVDKERTPTRVLRTHGAVVLAPREAFYGEQLLDGILTRAEWVQALGAGAVGMVLLPRSFPHVAIKVSMYETGFRTPLFTHPTRSEPAMMRLLMRTLLAGRATPHLPILFSERHDVPLQTLRIPEAFWRSSTAAAELRQWIERRRNCDPDRCSVLCMERFAGGTLFHALCRGTAPGVDIFAVRELAFQIIFTLAVILRFHPDWKHNDLSLANVMLRRRGTLTTTRLDASHLLVQASWAQVSSFSSSSSSPIVSPLKADSMAGHPHVTSRPVNGIQYRRYEFEGSRWFLPLRPEQPFEAVLADFDFACIDPVITNAKVDFFERQTSYHCYRINSQRDWYGDIQMLLSNLREVVHHLIRKRLDTLRPSINSSRLSGEQAPGVNVLLPEERDAVEFFERRVHPSCRDTPDRSLRGRLPPSSFAVESRYGPIETLLNDPYFDPFREPPNWAEGAILEASFAWPMSPQEEIHQTALGAGDNVSGDQLSPPTLWPSSSPIQSEWECSRDPCAAEGA